MPLSVLGPLRPFTKVGSPPPFALTCSPPPFALSLSKGQAEPVEAFGMRHEGFDKLSPNGKCFAPTLNFAFGPKAAV